jgi:hypothetical protein
MQSLDRPAATAGGATHRKKGAVVAGQTEQLDETLSTLDGFRAAGAGQVHRLVQPDLDANAVHGTHLRSKAKPPALDRGLSS